MTDALPETATPQEYKILVCPLCREQLWPDRYDYDEYDDVPGHTHDEVYYKAVEVTAVEWSADADEFRRAIRRAKDAHRRNQKRIAADRAELAALEAEWRASAPDEQVLAYDESRACEMNGLRSVASMSQAIKEVWGSPEAEEQHEDSARVSRAMFFGTDEERDEAYRVQHEHELRRLRDTLALFETEGPARVAFWKLRDTRRKLAELEAA